MVYNPITSFPAFDSRYSNITPFTYRDGMSHVHKLELLQKYVRDTLVNHIDKSLADFAVQLDAQITALIKVVNDKLTEQDENTTEKLDEFQTEIDALTEQVTNLAQMIIPGLPPFDVRRYGASPTKTAAENNVAFYAAVADAGTRPVFYGEKYKVSLKFVDTNVNINSYGGGELLFEAGVTGIDILNTLGPAIPVTVNPVMVIGPASPAITTDTQMLSTITLPSNTYADFAGGDLYHLESKDPYPFAAGTETLTDPANVNVWKAEFIPLLGIGIDVVGSTGSIQEGRTVVGVSSGASALVDSVIFMNTTSVPSTIRKAMVSKITKAPNGAGFTPGETLRYNGLDVGTVGAMYLVVAGRVSGGYPSAPNIRKVRSDLLTRLDVVTNVSEGVDTNANIGVQTRTASRGIWLHGLNNPQITAYEKDGWTRFLVPQSCYRGTYKITVDKLPNKALETEYGFGYAVEVTGCTEKGEFWINATKVRHGYTTNSSPATYALGNVLQHGTPKDNVAGGVFTHCYSAALDTHPGSEGQIFRDYVIAQPASGNRYQTTPSAINDRGFGTKILQGTINGGKRAVTLAGMAYVSELPYTTVVKGVIARDIDYQGIATSTVDQASFLGGEVTLLIQQNDIEMNGRSTSDPYYHNVYYLDAYVNARVSDNRSAKFNGAPGYARNLKSFTLQRHTADYSAFTTGATGWRVEGTLGRTAIATYSVIGGGTDPASPYPASAIRNVVGDTEYNFTGFIGAIDGPAIPVLAIDTKVPVNAPRMVYRDRPGKVNYRTNNSYTYVPGENRPVHVYNTPLGDANNREFTLLVNGTTPDREYVRVVRTAAATGAATLTVAGKVLTPGSWVDVQFDASVPAWVVIGSGTL